VGVRHRAPDRVTFQPAWASAASGGHSAAAGGHRADEHGAAAQGQAGESGPRRARRRRGARGAQLPFAIVLAAAVGGAAWIWQGQQYVRGGTLAVAAALFVAALARLVLPERRAGMLVSRRRLTDVTALAVLATGLLVAGLVLPTPS
jgi:hypothetical protein